MSSRANNTMTPADKAYGLRVEWESLITPAIIIGAGFSRTLKSGQVVPATNAFYKAVGVSESLWHKIRNGEREPSPEFRVKASRVLKLPEDRLFRRRIEGERA